MTSAFILNIDVGSDTDLLSIAAEITDACEHEGMSVVSCKPWAHPSLSTTSILPPTTLSAPAPTPPDVSGLQQ